MSHDHVGGWQAMLPDGSPTNVSYNHYANGCVGDFIYRRIGGLTATAPGYRTFDVRPDYRCGLERASLGYDSVNDRIANAIPRKFLAAAGAALVLADDILAAGGWKSNYLVYLIALPIPFAVLAFLPLRGSGDASSALPSAASPPRPS